MKSEGYCPPHPTLPAMQAPMGQGGHPDALTLGEGHRAPSLPPGSPNASLKKAVALTLEAVQCCLTKSEVGVGEWVEEGQLAEGGGWVN